MKKFIALFVALLFIFVAGCATVTAPVDVKAPQNSPVIFVLIADSPVCADLIGLENMALAIATEDWDQVQYLYDIRACGLTMENFDAVLQEIVNGTDKIRVEVDVHGELVDMWTLSHFLRFKDTISK